MCCGFPFFDRFGGCGTGGFGGCGTGGFGGCGYGGGFGCGRFRGRFGRGRFWR